MLNITNPMTTKSSRQCISYGISYTKIGLHKPVNTVCKVYGVLPIRFFHDIGHIGKTSKLNHYAWGDHYAWGEHYAWGDHHTWCKHYTYDKYCHCERSRKACVAIPPISECGLSKVSSRLKAFPMQEILPCAGALPVLGVPSF